MKIVNAQVFNGTDFVSETVYMQNGVFVAAADYTDDGEVLDAAGKVVAPGLVDIHFHGCMHQDFSNGTPEALSTLATYEASVGVTAICPATMTFPESVLNSVMDVAAAFRPLEDQADLVGINMEGPYISPGKVGAQNPAYVQAADEDMFERLQARSGGLIKLVDIAPEEPGNMDFIQNESAQVRCSVAHTCTDYDTAKAAFDAGARHMTHLFNAMPGLHHRNPGPIAAAAERNDVTAEIIADGVHIHPAMVRLAFNLFGDDRMIIISDSLESTGLADGEYQLGGQPITVKGNRATLHDGTLAGSNTNLAGCLKTAVTQMAIPLTSALKAATQNPARAIGIFDRFGSIAPGKVASCIILNDQVDVETVILRGRVL